MYNSSSLSQDAILKITKIELEFIADTDMYIFLAKGQKKQKFLYF